MAVEADEARFEGFTPRECAEHRTTGGRAWCHSDQEWCYPTDPCRGCELPQLRAALSRLASAAGLVCVVLADAGRLHATTGGPELADLAAAEQARR
jgi:hypothetical protein